MPEPSEPHAFISYVRDDSPLVDELEQVLAAAGIPVWRDVKDLFPGDDWKQRIREAIQGNSLAFIPVFSKRSEARDRSQMREEIRLAIGEYRLMAPDRPWIFSVRLDDVTVPGYRLGPDQYLADLQWTDFFGDKKTVSASRLIGRIQRLLERTSPGIAQPVAVAASATDATRGAIFTTAIREGMLDPARAALARELLIQEARRVAKAMNDTTRFPMTRPDGNITSAVFTRTQKLSALIAPIVEASVELGARGRPEDASVATQLVASLAREGFSQINGPHLDAFARLRKFPAVCVLAAGALGATATRNADMLAAFVAEPRVEAFYQDSPVPGVLSPWDPFGPTWHMAQFINAASEGNEATEDVLVAYDAGNIRRTPAASASTVLRRVLATPAEPFAVSLHEFDELFDRTEVLIAAIADYQLTQQGADYRDSAENWLGNHQRPAPQTKRMPMAERMCTELEQARDKWWPLHNPGLFGGDYRQALSCLGDLVEIEDKVQRKSPSS